MQLAREDVQVSEGRESAYVVELIRGLGLGGAETLLRDRLRARTRTSSTDWRTVINTAPQYGHYADAIDELADEYVELGSGSVISGIWATWRHAARCGSESVVVSHSPASSVGYKLRKALTRSDFALVDVAHASEYKLPYLILGRLLNRYADHCICVSEAVASASTTRGYRSKSVVLGGVELDRMRKWVSENPGAPESFRAALALAEDTTLICNVANLTKVKNQQLLVRALTAPELHGVHLVIAGEGPERPRLEQLARELGVTDRLHLLGRTTDAWQWAAVSDLLIHSSHKEGLPVALMEGAALGVPMVVTPIAGLNELTSNGANLFVTDPETLAADLARALETTPAARQAWADRGAKGTFWDITRYHQEFEARLFGLRGVGR